MIKKNELDIDASEHLYKTANELHEKNEALTILITGPTYTFTKALRNHPKMKEYFEETYWIWGAIDVEGNIYDLYLIVNIIHIGILLILKNLLNHSLKLKYYLLIQRILFQQIKI